MVSAAINEPLKYLTAYPQPLQDKVAQLIGKGELGSWLRHKYQDLHDIRTDKALFDYVSELKNEFLRKADPLNKVAFDSKLQVIAHALGTHTAISRVQGNKLKAKREIRIASLFKDVPLAFLNMIAVHELAHIKEKAHDKAFYQLCTYMAPDYHQLEFDVRLYLTHIDHIGPLEWRAASPSGNQI
ncbi:MAG: hypothetical protein RL459_1563 [Pseudomonadota bacterium]